MKAIRKITDNNKALFGFGLVLFFLFAGLTKSFAGTKASADLSKKERGTYILAAENGCVQDLFKAFDSDSDDFECIFFGEPVTNNVFTALSAEKTFAGFTACKNSCTLRLYDLFCNWKLHIS